VETHVCPKYRAATSDTGQLPDRIREQKGRHSLSPRCEGLVAPPGFQVREM